MKVLSVLAAAVLVLGQEEDEEEEDYPCRAVDIKMMCMMKTWSAQYFNESILFDDAKENCRSFGSDKFKQKQDQAAAEIKARSPVACVYSSTRT